MTAIRGDEPTPEPQPPLQLIGDTADAGTCADGFCDLPGGPAGEAASPDRAE